ALFRRDALSLIRREIASLGPVGPAAGARVLTTEERRNLTRVLAQQGIVLYNTGSSTASLHRVLESGTVQIGLRNDATVYNLFHELSHHMTYLESRMTPRQWNALAPTVRERLAFDHLERNYWNFLTREERVDAVAYAWKH